MRGLAYSIILITALASCSKKGSDNPYDNWEVENRKPVLEDKPIDPNTIQGLHKHVFKPTCSNSGCHDGNFEPDFRTVESTYNSLIDRFSTNTDPDNPQFSKRVVPGDAAKSMLIHRLSVFIPGSQGIMPLSVDPGSDWNEKKNEYIQNIKNWINDGAKDQFGNAPAILDFSPQPGGLLVYADGSAVALPRSGFNPVNVPPGAASLRLLVSFIDDKTPVSQFGTTTINFSLNPNVYDSTSLAMQTLSQAVQAKGLNGADVEYWHYIDVNTDDIGLPGDVIWFRTETSDQVNPPLFIPGKDASFNTVKYFAIRLN